MGEEKNFENRVKTYLKEQGTWYVKYWGGGGFTKAGVPDLLVCIRGVFVGIEVKASGGRPSDLQLHTLHEIDEAGGWGLLLYPQDFELFKGFVKAVWQDDLNDMAFYFTKINHGRFVWAEKR